MFVGKSIVYLDLQKTGSSTISKVLQSISSEEGTKFNDHITLDQLPHHIKEKCLQKIKLGSIRNPWAWYVSLWAYGCQGQGALFKINTTFSWELFNKKRTFSFFTIPRKKWSKLYSDSNSIENFKKWLEWTIHAQKRNHLLAYNRSPLQENIGLYTFRYLRLYIDNFMDLQKNIHTKNDIIKLDDNHNILDGVIRQESLKSDLLEFLNNQDVNLGEETLNLLQQKMNTSHHLHYQDYYDEESIKWIEEREWLIINKYGYTYKN